MKIQEKYNIQETANTFSFCPKKPTLAMSWWFLAGILAGILLLLFFGNCLDQAMRWAIYILMGYFVLHSWYDIQIGSKIRYTFDANENAVYKSSPLRAKTKIMKLEEIVIFIHSEMGSSYYALGAKKRQFIKSYIISEGFSAGKKCEIKQQAYEDFILMKIEKLQDSVLKNTQIKNT
ncbi:hypothetical protein GON26_01660 [Flavobacterium sp. GA093]|uniref:Uncharacterized protein n=1 Tax=Flavobacterium hydrocarbonoxydans TaxID=2683249 RepID=A0A6I4NKE7_9FLAO|nr:hypothetical protein [Flavobacterium hydrocarbonoxydans]MWB93055.1 hypothetical protein [Flavobacterium hydrocarbonoxydans]